MNEIKIRLLIKKNPALTEDIQIFTYLSFTIVEYVYVVIINGFDCHFIITFFVFCENFNLEREKI